VTSFQPLCGPVCLRTSGASTGYSLEEVARFYAFLVSVKSLVKALAAREPDSFLGRTQVDEAPEYAPCGCSSPPSG